MSRKQLDELFDTDFDASIAPVEKFTPPPPQRDTASTDFLPDGEVDKEGAMAKADLYKLSKYATKLYKKLEDEDQLEAWVQAKITKAADYIASVYHYLEYEMDFSKYGHKLDNADTMNESEKAALHNKLIEARTKIAELKKLQALKLDEGKSPKAKKDYDKDGKIESEKDEVIGSRRKAAGLDQKCDEMYYYGDKKDQQRSANKSKDELNIRSKDGVANHGQEYKDMKKKGKLSVSGPKGKLPEEINEVSDDIKSSWLKKGHKKIGKEMQDAKGDKETISKNLKSMSSSLKPAPPKRKKESCVKEAVKQAKKDYDGDGKVESGKDEYLGSKDKAIKKATSKECNENTVVQVNENAELNRVKEFLTRLNG